MMTVGPATTLRKAVAEDLTAALAAYRAPAPPTAGREAEVPGVVTLGAHDVSSRTDPEAEGRPTARVHLSAMTAIIGPFPLSSGRGPCGHCLALRWQRLRPASERTALEFGHDMQAVAPWPHLLPHVVAAIHDLLGAAASQPPPTDQRLPTSWVWSLELTTLRIRRFPLVPDPLCPARCTPSPSRATHLRLAAAPKRTTGTYRRFAAEHLALPADSLANPVCGVLGTHTMRGIDVSGTAPVSGRAMMSGAYGLTEMTWSGQANSFSTSKNLAFLEGLERYAGLRSRLGEEPVIAAYADVQETALDPRECGTYAPETYEQEAVCEPFDPHRAIPWVWGTDLTNGSAVLVPRRLVHYGRQPGDRSAPDTFVYESSNGCASGASPAEAILFGLLELIERDAFVLGWYGGTPLPAMDVRGPGLDNCGLSMMLDRAELLGYAVRLFDNRIDLPIPVVTAVAVRRDGGPGTLGFAAAAHPEPREAAMGAIAEALTYLPQLARRARDERERVEAMAQDYSLVRQLRDHSALFTHPDMAHLADRYVHPESSLSFHDAYADWQGARPRVLDIREDVVHLTRILAGAGHRVIVVDQSAPEQSRLGLHTFATLVPGLLPLDFGWSRQRALRMPRMLSAHRRAGLRDTDLSSRDLHLVPHPFP